MSDPTPETTAIPISNPAAGQTASRTPQPISAVQRCRSAYYHAAAAGSKDQNKAAEAYRNAIPSLTNPAAIRDFIACVADGMLLRVFWHDEGPKLIAAARAALAAQPREVRPLGRPPGIPAGSINQKINN